MFYSVFRVILYLYITVTDKTSYQNGSLLIATLQPRFTILHNLTTSRGPSPIVTLSWHASSVRSKSDMLAVQTNDGDLRVWSVSKAYSSDDPAKIVRILKRTENYLTGPNWMGWSKNGRIVQFSEAYVFTLPPFQELDRDTDTDTAKTAKQSRGTSARNTSHTTQSPRSKPSAGWRYTAPALHSSHSARTTRCSSSTSTPQP